MISFIIVSGGHRPESLQRLFDSIELQSVPDCEIIVVGCNNGPAPAGAVYIDRPDLADSAAICSMRNLGLDAARHDTVILLDDDVEFTDGWFNAIRPRLCTGYDMAGCRVITPAGERWYDWAWASRIDVTCPTRLADYDEVNNHIYIGGCFMMIRRHVFDEVRFDERLLNHQRDDVDYCRRVWEAGFKLTIFSEATVVHHLDPAGRSESDPASGPKLYSFAINLFRRGQWAEACTLFDQVERFEPVKALYHKALCKEKLEEHDDALTGLLEVIAKADRNLPEDKRLYYTACYHAGRLYEAKCFHEEALKAYKTTLEGFPEHLKARQGIGRINGS